ncbi:PQQ-binding-like beta-propeller repeat protein [Candidatus Woesearchaeota archaeon]|nr:PQQ-binding-like beta-propeller repeat protein [Candidatus Woesearchaeota archaeon]
MKRIITFGIVFLILGPAIIFANSPPKLVEGHAKPAVATSGTLIVYQVTYIDEEGDAPEYVRLIFTGIAAEDMRKLSGNYKTGAVYEFSWKQNDSIDYRFEASDGEMTAKLPWYGGTLAPVNIISEKLESNRIYFFSRQNSEPLWSYDLGKSQVQNTVISDDGSSIAVKTNDYIYFFSKDSNNPLWKHPCETGAEDPSGGSGWVDISADGGYIAGGCRESLNLFSKSGKLLWTYRDNIGIYAVSISADGEHLAAGTSFSDELIFFSRKSNKPIWKYQATSDVHGLSLSSDGNLVAAGSHSPEERAYLFSKDSNNPLTAHKTSPDSPVWTAAMSRDGKYSVYGLDSSDTYNSIFLFSNDKNTPLKTWTTDWWVRSVDISSNGKYIVAGSGDHNVYLIDRDKDEPLWKFESGERVGSVSISQDGNYIAAGSKDKKVYLFSRESKIPSWDYNADSWVDSVAISANGEYIVAGTGAANYMSEGHHPIFNPEKRLEIEGNGTGTGEKNWSGAGENLGAETEISEKETTCGDGICEGTEAYESCPRDCCGENCESPEDVPEGKNDSKKEEVKPEKEKGLFGKIIGFFGRLFGR